MAEIDDHYAAVALRLSPPRAAASAYALRGPVSHIAMMASSEDLYVDCPVSFASVSPAPVVWYYDNATSLSITNQLSELTDVVLLTRPFP